MIRSCVWSSESTQQLINIVGLYEPEKMSQTFSKRLVKRIDSNASPYGYSLPSNSTHVLNSVSLFGSSKDLSDSRSLLNSFNASVDQFMDEIHRNLRIPLNLRANITGDVDSLQAQLTSLTLMIEAGDCTRIHKLYSQGVEDDLCRTFVSWTESFGILLGSIGATTLCVFLFAFFVGHRVFPRYESLRRRDEPEDEPEAIIVDDHDDESEESPIIQTHVPNGDDSEDNKTPLLQPTVYPSINDSSTIQSFVFGQPPSSVQDGSLEIDV